jgi:hypothetical protein
MPLTYNQYTGDGSTKQYTLSFPYISKDHVFVRVDGENVPFTWLNDTTVVLGVAPPSGASVVVYRSTPNDRYLVSFKAGTGFREADLNRMSSQVFYIVQEALENLDVEEINNVKASVFEARDDVNTAVSSATALVEEAEMHRNAASSFAQSSNTAATQAQSYAAAAFGATAPPWDALLVYNYPDVVCYTDGHTYRCTASNVTSVPPHSVSEWTRITVSSGDFFELDATGGMMPTTAPGYSEQFELDPLGDIMPVDA